jgi:hypothetical protein
MLSPLKEKPKMPVQPPSCHIAPDRSESQRVKVILFRQITWTTNLVNVDKISHATAAAAHNAVEGHSPDSPAPRLTRHRGVTCQDPPSEL